MLTNKKIIVLIIMLSFFFTSCISNNDKTKEVIKNENSINVNTVNWEWKKGKSTWGESLQKGTEKTIYNWKSTIPKLEPKNIK